MAVPRPGGRENERENSGFISPIRLAEMNRIQQATSQPSQQASQPPLQPPRDNSRKQRGPRPSSFFSSFRSDSRTSGEGNAQAATMSRYDEYGRLQNDKPQPARNPTQHSTPAKLQSHRARGHSGSGGGTLQRRTSLAVAPLPRISAGKTLHPEIEQVVALTLAHSSKIYCSGPLGRKIERQSDGTPAKGYEIGWSEVWAQLGGTTVSVWDMQAINKASQEGKEVPPSYLNVTDSQVQVHGSMTSVIPGTNQQERKENIVALNTAGENLIVFACPTPQSLVSWATALRLASWEKSRIEEIYTGHLLRLSLVENDQFREPHSTLNKGRMEGWAKVRVGGTTEWQRIWFVVSATGGGGSIDAGRPSPGSGPGTIKRNRMSIFGKGSNHNEFAPPTVTLYTSEKTKDRKRPKYTLTNVTQAFAVYPERPEIIQSSTLFKIEGSVQDEEIKPNEHARRPAQDGYLLVMPEAEPTRPGSTEMLKWLVAIHDAFGLYGRPEGYVWDPRDQRSMFFTYPVGPYRDHLFLDRELAEVLDAREHSTSKVRAALTGILVDRLRGPPPPPLQMRGPPQPVGQAPKLPALGFDSERPRPEGPSASFQGQTRLSPIEDRSTTHESPVHPTLLPNPPPQSQSLPTALDERSSHQSQNQNQAPPNNPTYLTPVPVRAPNQSHFVEPAPVYPSASQRPPGTVPTATPPELAPTPSRKLSPPVRGDTLPVNLSHSRMPTTVDSQQSPPPIHSSPVQMLSPLSATSAGSRSTTGVNISGAPPESSTARSLSVPPPESSTRSSSWQPPSGPPPGASGLSMPPPPNTSLTSNVPPASPLNVAPPPGPPPSGGVSSQPPSQAGTRRQDTSHDYQLLNEAAVSYMQRLEGEDERPAQPQTPLPPRLAALEAVKNVSATNGMRPPTESARAHAFSTATASGSFSASPLDNKTTSFDQTPSSPSSYPTTPDSRVPPQASTSNSRSMSQQQRPQQYDEGTFDAAGALAALSFAETPPEPVKSQYPVPPPIPNEEGTPTESESDAPSGTHVRSSFATGNKAAQRKARAQAHQAATQEALHRPGRPNGKKAGKKPAGAWGSSDEDEDEDDEDEDEDEDEDDEDDPAPSRSNNRTPSNFDHVRSPSNVDHGQPSIVSPQPRQYYSQAPQQNMGYDTSYSPAHSEGVHAQQHPRAARMLPQPPDMPRGQSPYQQQEFSRQSSGTDHRRHLDPHDDPRGRRMYDDQPRSLSPNRPPPPQLAAGPSRPVWSTVLDPDHDQKNANERTFVTIEANETMTKAFTPQGLLQAGIQDKQDRSAKRQEELARETGASLINVPHKPPPPQTGLLGAITAHERERKREGGVGAALTERERERRMAEERQRKFDEMQRQQLDQMSLNGPGGSNGAMEMYGQGGMYPMNPMMMNPMMWGMNPMMMMGGYGMPPMGMGGVPGGVPGGMPGGMPGMPQMNPQQMWAAQQAAMQAYQNAMVSFSQAGSDAGNGAAGDATPAGGQRGMSPIPGAWGGMGMGMMPGMMPGYGMGMASAPGSGFLQPNGQQGMNMSPGPGEGARISMALSNNNSPNLSPARYDSPRGGTPQVQ